MDHRGIMFLFKRPVLIDNIKDNLEDNNLFCVFYLLVFCFFFRLLHVLQMAYYINREIAIFAKHAHACSSCVNCFPFGIKFQGTKMAKFLLS